MRTTITGVQLPEHETVQEVVIVSTCPEKYVLTDLETGESWVWRVGQQFVRPDSETMAALSAVVLDYLVAVLAARTVEEHHEPHAEPSG